MILALTREEWRINMKIKIFDVDEKRATSSKNLFKEEVLVKQNENGLFNLSFDSECTLSTYVYPANPEVIIMNRDNSKMVCFCAHEFNKIKIY